MSIKKIILSLAIIAIVIPVNSCKKFLAVNPVSSFGPDYVFANVTNATQAVLGVYAALTGDNGYGIRLSMYFPYDDDNIEGQAATPFPDNDRRDIAHYNTQPSNAQIDLPFNQLFSGVERANLCIYYIPKMAQYNDPTNGPLLQRLYGEALTLRAQFYLELLRNWGDLPAQFLPALAQTNLQPAKTDRDTIYNHLLNDLQIAEGLVPWRGQVTIDQRITKGAVKALRARIALFRAGWSLRRTGIMQQGSNPQLYYQIADTECASIVNSGYHQLEPNYQDVFKKYLDAGAVDPTGEVIWQVAFSGGTGTTDSKLGYYNGPKYTSTYGNSALTILPSYFYLFDPTDSVRRDVTVCDYDIANAQLQLNGRALYKLVDGKFRRDWIPNAATSSAQYFGANWPLIRYSDVLLMYAEAENEVNNGPTGQAITALNMVRTRAGVASLTTFAGHDDFFNAVVKERSLELGGEGIRKYDLIRWNLIATRLAQTKQELADMVSGTDDQWGAWSQYAGIKNVYYDNVNSTTATGMIYIPGKCAFYPQTIGGCAGTATGGGSLTWISGGITTSILTEYAVDFRPNHSELLPIPQAAIDANPNLTQDYGY